MVSVIEAEGEPLNGLGMMMSQYMAQNLAEFEYKEKQALAIRCRVAVEVNKGFAITTVFTGERIIIANGVLEELDLYLKSDYLVLSKVLSGKTSPFFALLKGSIKVKAWPRRPFQAIRVLRFLKIPKELLS